MESQNYRVWIVTKRSEFLIASLFVAFCVGCATNPITGRDRFMLVPESYDVEIGRAYSPEVDKQLGGRIDNHDLQDYIDEVGQGIARGTHRPDLEYHFTAVNEESINALALPGGYIFITKGMLENMTNEAQLASILGHEMTHVIARHSSEQMSLQIGISLVLAFVVPGETPEGVGQMIDIARQFVSLKYSRDDERQADMTGLDYMVTAGYDPNEMVETMRMLENQNEARPIEFFSTHPSPHNRIMYLEQRIRSRYYGLDGLRVGQKSYQESVLNQLDD